MKLGPVSRLVVSGVLALSVLVLAMTVRAVLEARVLLRQAQAELGAGELEVLLAREPARFDRALTSLRLAARWDAPFNVYADAAFVALERMAATAEAHADNARALAAYRAIHASAMATRSAFGADDEILQRIDAHIFALAQSEAQASAEARTQARNPDRDAYLAALRPDRPRAIGILVAWFGFAAWVGGASVFLRRGVDAQGRLVKRVARQGALFVLLGWIAFALGLRIA
jgi:hypothetical protein